MPENVVVKTVSLEESDWKIVDDFAKQTGQARSSAVRFIIREWALHEWSLSKRMTTDKPDAPEYETVC